MTDSSDGIVQAVLSALQETDVWKFMESKMAEEQGGGDEGLDEGMDAPLDGDEAPLDEMPEEEAPVEDDLEDEVDDEPMPPKKQYSAPSGSNTSVPKVERVKMQRDQLRGKLHRYQALNQATMKELNDLKLKFQASEREKDLIQLESEGYLFDRAEELEVVTSLPEKAYKKRLGLIRKRYQKAPITVGGRQVHLASSDPSRGTTQSKKERVVEYATEHGISYSDALKALEGEKVF